MKKHSVSDLEARRERALAAAQSVFFRHGYARATIGDIAKQAHLHRPALYALFRSGKVELFDAVLIRYVNREISRYRAEIRRLRTPRQKVLHCVEQWATEGLRLTTAYPDAADAFNVAYPSVRRMYDVLITFYAELLRESVAASPLRISTDDLARLLVFSLRGVREVTADAAAVRPYLVKQIEVLFAALA